MCVRGKRRNRRGVLRDFREGKKKVREKIGSGKSIGM